MIFKWRPLMRLFQSNQASLVNRQDSIVTTSGSSLLEYQASLVNRQDSISRLQEALFDYQDSSVNHQDSIVSTSGRYFKLPGLICTTSRICFKLSGFNCATSRLFVIALSPQQLQAITFDTKTFLTKYPLPNNSFQPCFK